MHHISDYLSTRVSPGPPYQEPSAQKLNTKYQVLSTRQKRQIVRSTELVPAEWLPWHCKAVGSLGPDIYLDLAEMAREGNNPRTLFGWLIREELNR
jgi:hypothetical protein